MQETGRTVVLMGCYSQPLTPCARLVQCSFCSPPAPTSCCAQIRPSSASSSHSPAWCRMDSRRLSRPSRRFEDLDRPPLAFEHVDTPTTSDTLDPGLVRDLMSHMTVEDGSVAGGSPHSARLEGSGSGMLPLASGSLEAAEPHKAVTETRLAGQQAHQQHLAAGPAREPSDAALVQKYVPSN